MHLCFHTNQYSCTIVIVDLIFNPKYLYLCHPICFYSYLFTNIYSVFRLLPGQFIKYSLKVNFVYFFTYSAPLHSLILHNHVPYFLFFTFETSLPFAILILSGKVYYYFSSLKGNEIWIDKLIFYFCSGYLDQPSLILI